MTYIHRSVKKNIKCIKTTSNTEQKAPHSSFDTVDGSIVEYTPIEGCTHVVYDYTTYFATDMGYALNGGVRIQLQIGDSSSSYGDIVTNNDNYTTHHGATYHETSTRRRHHMNQSLIIKHAIPLADWPRDSDNRLKTQTLLLRVSKYASNLCMLHGTTTDTWAYADGDTLHYDPFLLIYCL